MSASSSSSDDGPSLPDGLLPLSSSSSPLPAYLSMLGTEAQDDEEHEEQVYSVGSVQFRKRRKNGSSDPGGEGSSRYRHSGKRRKRRSIRQVLSDWNGRFERAVFRVESWVEYAIHCIFRVVEFILLATQRVGILVLSKIRVQWARRFGERMHYFTRPVSLEQLSAINRDRQYIWILYELRRKFIFNAARRMYIYRIILLCLMFTIIACIGLFYTAEMAEYNSHIRYVSVDSKTGREIMNLMYPPEFPRAGYNEDVDWLLYAFRERENPLVDKLVPPMLKSDYVEVETRRFSRVNISIREMVDRMKEDSAEAGNKMLQPCLCPAHYGIPLNIVLIRYSLEDSTDEEPMKSDVVYYEPHVSTYVSDSVRGSVSMDSLVIPPETRLQKSKGLSALESDLLSKQILEISKKHEERRTLVVDLTDSFVGPYLHLRGSDDVNQRKQVYERTRNMISQENINGMKKNMKEYHFRGELTIGYASIGIRSLGSDGEKLPVAYIHSPYSYCVQRCLSAVDPYF